jgi:hypothetical protein
MRGEICGDSVVKKIYVYQVEHLKKEIVYLFLNVPRHTGNIAF